MATGKSGYVDIASGWITARLYWSDDYDIASNTSKVSITNIQFMSSNYYGPVYYLNGSVTVNGSTVASFSSSQGGYTFKPVTQGAFYDMAVASGFAAPPFTSGSITHNADGSKSATIGISVNGYTINGNYGSGWGCSGSTTVVLTTIPRASSMSVGNGTLGVAQTITVSRASTSFSHTITYTCGTASGTICTKSTSDAVSFTPPLDLAYQNVSATSVAVKLKLQTYSGDTAIGDPVYTTVSMAIPASIVPSVSLSVSDANNYLATYGGYVQNKSKAYVAASGAGSYGSSIIGYTITCGSGSGSVSAASGTFGLPTAGTITVTATVTDSRGRQASKSTTISVLAYSAPSAWITSLSRQNQDGSTNAQGAYAMTYFSGSVTSLGGKNSANYTFLYRVKGGSWISEARSDLSGNYAPANVAHGFSADVNSAYEVCIAVSDNFSYVESAYATIQAISALLDFDKTNNAVGIGQRAQKTNTLSIGLYAEFLGGTNLPESGFKDLGWNPITSPADDTAANWCAIGTGRTVYTVAGALIDQPSQYGVLINFTDGWEVFQIYHIQSIGPTFYRSGNGNGWAITWRKYIDSTQSIHASTADSAAYFANMYLDGSTGRIKDTNGRWLDPPMYAGTNYAIKEKFLGSNVYTGVINCGCLPASSVKEVAHGFSSNFVVFDYGGFQVTRPNGTVTSSFSLPYRDYVKLDIDKNVIRIETTYDYATSAEVFVWYKGLYV